MFDEHIRAFRTCQTCPSLCQSVCPVFINDGIKTHSPQGLMQLLNLVRKNKMDFDESIATEPYHCLDCRACTELCEHNIDVGSVMQAGRNEAYRQELAPKEINSFVERFHRHNNPFSRDLVKKLKNMLPKRYFNPNNSVVYFPSCSTVAKCPEIIKDTFSLFDKFQIDFVSLFADPIHCCGYPLLSCGAAYDFVDIAEINYHALKNYKTIITGCPVCAHVLKNIYAKYDFNLSRQVVTVNQFLKPYFKDMNYTVKKKVRSKVMFHDPCYLARYMDEYELPREMISRVSGYEPLEFHDNRKSCSCCGQGAAYPIVERERANQITKNRLEECYEKKANLLISQCPICLYKMREQSNKLVIKDVISYLNDCIEETSSS
jgi:Fe-S oxidoreductase